MWFTLTAIGIVFLLVTIPTCWWCIHSYNNKNRAFSFQAVQETNRQYAPIVINHKIDFL
jgi:hypothetical protein